MSTLKTKAFTIKKPNTSIKKPSLLKRMKDAYQLYILVIPIIVYFVVFQYLPMYGIQIAFRDFSYSKGFFGSPWVGLQYFERFILSPDFPLVMRNTFCIGLYSLALLFPFPIILALLLHNLPGKRYRSIAQSVTYAPYFISTVVVAAVIYQLLSPKYGIVNQLVAALGFEKIFFMGEAKYFYSIYALSDLWQFTGYSSIIFIAALTAINPELYEAAMMDGATKLQRIIHIDLPGIMNTVIILLILNTGSLLNVTYEKAYALQNPLNRIASDVITTFVYTKGLRYGELSYASAIGLFNTIMNFILLIAVNKLAKKYSEVSIW